MAATTERVKFPHMYLTKAELAVALRCSKRTIERYVSSEFLGFPRPVRRIGGKLLWRSTAVEDWLRKQEQTAN
jgi:excisionase family DNA binding protein